MVNPVADVARVSMAVPIPVPVVAPIVNAELLVASLLRVMFPVVSVKVAALEPELAPRLHVCWVVRSIVRLFATSEFPPSCTFCKVVRNALSKSTSSELVGTQSARQEKPLPEFHEVEVPTAVSAAVAPSNCLIARVPFGVNGLKAFEDLPPAKPATLLNNITLNGFASVPTSVL